MLEDFSESLRRAIAARFADAEVRQEPGASWVPTPAEARQSLGFQRELEALLDPLDYQIAEIVMKHRIVHGDPGELARLLPAEGRTLGRARVMRALHNIREALAQIQTRRGIRR
jgi:hypothetical protein